MDNVGFQGGLIVWLVWLLTLGIFVFEIFMIIDAIKNKKLSDSAKALWIVGIIVLNPVGVLAYYFVAYSKRH